MSHLATINEIIDAAMTTKKGVNVQLQYERNCKTLKGCGDAIRKRTQTVGRVGIDYSNQAKVQALRDAGELPTEEQPIWHGKGEWIIFPYILRHTVTNQLYLRLYSGTSKTFRPSTQYFRNGVEVSFDSVKDDLLKSEKPDKTKPAPLCYCVKLEDMIQIGRIDDDPAEIETEPETIEA